MDATLRHTVELLEALIAFPSVSRRPNLDIVGFIAAQLQRFGVEAHLLYDDTGQRANLFATVGPEVDGGIVLSGHTDVVPVDGQEWALPPFEMTARDGVLYGRGATDMKGFLACALAAVPLAQERRLKRPLHLALTYDEEPGSLGAPGLARFITDLHFRPSAVLVGEPTRMMPVAGHKGGLELTTSIEGFACHSSDPRKGVSALHYALRYIRELERLADELAASAPVASPFDPPASTVNVGLLHAGTARNIVAGACTFDWEIRLSPPDDGAAILDYVHRTVERHLLQEMRERFGDARIETVVEAAYPGLLVEPTGQALALARALSGHDGHDVVPFGTDAGCFQRAGLSTVVIGPGSIDQAHKPDEFIAIAELERALGFMARLVDQLAAR